MIGIKLLKPYEIDSVGSNRELNGYDRRDSPMRRWRSGRREGRSGKRMFDGRDRERDENGIGGRWLELKGRLM